MKKKKKKKKKKIDQHEEDEDYFYYVFFSSVLVGVPVVLVHQRDFLVYLLSCNYSLKEIEKSLSVLRPGGKEGLAGPLKEWNQREAGEDRCFNILRTM